MGEKIVCYNCQSLPQAGIVCFNAECKSRVCDICVKIMGIKIEVHNVNDGGCHEFTTIEYVCTPACYERFSRSMGLESIKQMYDYITDTTKCVYLKRTETQFIDINDYKSDNE